MALNELIGNKEKAILHIAKAQLGMSDEAYSDMLESVGVSSSKELDFKRYRELMERLKAAGFRKVHKSAKKSGMDKKFPREKAKMLSYMESILADLELPWSYADGMAKRMFGSDRLRFLDGQQTYKLLQALIIYQERQKKKLQENLA